MRFDQNSERRIVNSNWCFSAIALLAAILGGATALAQPTLEAEHGAVIEAGRGKDVIIHSSKKPLIAGAGGVIVAAPDEEVFSDSAAAISDAAAAPDAPEAPEAPRAMRPKRKVQNQKGDETVQRRLMELERKIENLAERDRVRLKNAPLEFNQREFARVQKEIERAGREAEMAGKRFRHSGVDHDLVFEHKFAIAGDGKMQRKALEAQRKALEKQLEAVNKRIESLEGSEESEGDEGGKIEFREEKKDASPSLPPE